MKVMAASQRLRARVTSSRGAAQFIGDDSSRQKAAIVFDNEIRDFESKHSALVNKCAAQL
jgi:hypothetical protein